MRTFACNVCRGSATEPEAWVERRGLRCRDCHRARSAADYIRRRDAGLVKRPPGVGSSRANRVALGKLSREEAFASLVSRAKGCWLWTGYRMKNGYGQFWHRGEFRLAHRASFEIHVGPIPPGLFVCHRCDNPQCVNPEHLFLGTNADNLRDAAAKGRMHPGERTAQAVLTEDLVRELRRRWVPHVVSIRMLSREFGVSESAVYGAVSRRTWRHV